MIVKMDLYQIVFKGSSVLLLVFLLAACASKKQFTPVEYVGDKPFYPAVIGAFNDLRVKMEKFNVVKNYYRSGLIYNKQKNYKYKVIVALVKGMIKINFVQVQKLNIYSGQWVPVTGNIFKYGDSGFKNKLSKAVMDIVHHTGHYQTIKEQLQENIGFHYMVMKNLSKEDSREWIKREMKGKLYSVRLANEDTVFLINSSGKTDKKFIAHLHYNSESNSHDELPFEAEFDLDLHTNSEKYKKLKKGDLITVRAKIIDATVHVYITTFGLSLEEYHG